MKIKKNKTKKVCPKCGKLLKDKLNVEAVENLGVCLSCDHVESEIIESYKFNE